MRLTLNRVVTLLMIVQAAACTERKIVRIAEGSTGELLTFEFENAGQIFGDEAVQVRGFKVERCSDGLVFWEMVGNTREGVAVESLEYGTVPRGWKEETPSRPLTPACYTVKISGSEPAGFRVLPDGVVVELTAEELRDASL
jgi:hypothetical protein